jgi:hypothetical protein
MSQGFFLQNHYNTADNNQLEVYDEESLFWGVGFGVERYCARSLWWWFERKCDRYRSC